MITTDQPGKPFVLRADDLGSLDIGSPIYYRRILAGQVTGYALDENGKDVVLKVFVNAPYDRYVTSNARFWHASGIDLKLERFDELARSVPVLANIRPAGDKYLMEDFYYAGGLPSVMREIQHLLHTEALTANGKTIGENIANAPCYNREVIKTPQEPFMKDAGIAVLRGNLAPAALLRWRLMRRCGRKLSWIRPLRSLNS